MSEWKEFTLADCINKMNQGVNTTTEKVSYTESGIKVIRAKNILDYKIEFEDIVFINNETYDRLSINVKPKKYDVLYTNIGSQLGSAALVTIDDAFIIAWNVLRIQTNKGKLSPLYLVYLLNNPNIREDVRGYDSSSTMPFVSGKVLGAMKITIPPLPEQERIAEVLSSLDNKIDLLQRQNKTLEEMAETLFRQWFVEEAEDDWEAGLFSDLVTVKYGKDHQKLIDGIIPAYGSGGIMRMVNKALYEKESVLIPRKGTLSNIIYIDKPFWTVDTMFFTEMKKNNIAKFIYHFIKNQDLGSMNVGSAVPSMTTDILNNLPITIPPSTILERFEAEATYFYKKIDSNKNQIQHLESLRDILLPKLMSGQVTYSI